MSQEEALKRIVTEYPEYTTQAMQDIKDGVDLVEVLSLLDSRSSFRKFWFFGRQQTKRNSFTSAFV